MKPKDNPAIRISTSSLVPPFTVLNQNRSHERQARNAEIKAEEDM